MRECKSERSGLTRGQLRRRDSYQALDRLGHPRTPKNVTTLIDTSGADPRTSTIGGTAVPTAVSQDCGSGNNVGITTAGWGGTLKMLPFYVTIN
jgi:hypothetical protein